MVTVRHSCEDNMINLSAYSVLEVKGRDAAAFLQAQGMNDVAALAAGRWQWNGLLSAKGRVLFLFQLLRLDDERFWLLQPLPRAQALAAHLLGFRFRSKVEFNELRAVRVFGSPAASADSEVSELPPWSHQATARGIVLNEAPTRAGTLLLSDKLQEPGDHGDVGSWTESALRAGVPRIGEAVSGRFTPQMLGLEALPAFSVRKGCYPGQEIVARTHFLGAAKRRAQLIHADFVLAPGATLVDATGASSLGEVVDAHVSGDATLALCVLSQYLESDRVLLTRDGKVTA